MRFLVAFLAVVGYASASVISPLVLGVNPGDAQAAAIDTRAALRDNTQAWTDAARLNLDINRNINENLYWNNVAANQNAIAVAQNQAAVNSAILTGRLAVAPGNIAANQNFVAVAQRQAAVLNAAAITGRLGAATPLAISPIGIGAPLVGSPIAVKSINGLVTPYGLNPLGLGLRAW